MLTSAEAVYLDSSALIKLVRDETESLLLAGWLNEHPRQASCVIARVEVARAVMSGGATATQLARAALSQVALIPLSDALVEDAAELRPPVLRTLDAIHLAAARTLGADLGVVVTYDRRMADAARLLGLPTAAPGQS